MYSDGLTTDQFTCLEHYVWLLNNNHTRGMNLLMNIEGIITAGIVIFAILIANCCKTSLLFWALFCLWVLEKSLSYKWQMKKTPVMNIADMLDSSVSVVFWCSLLDLVIY